MILWRPTRPSRTNTKKRYPFHYRVQECKSRKSRDTWSNRQTWPWSKNEAAQRLTEFCQENALFIANTFFQQHKRRLHLLCSQRWKSSIQSAKTRLRPDCGSDHEILITKFRLKLKKVGKTIRPFKVNVKVAQLCLTLWPHGLYGLYSPWNSPGQNTRVGSLSLLQGIFPTQGWNQGFLHCRQIL